MAYEHVPLTHQGYPLPLATQQGTPQPAPYGAPGCWGSGYNSEDRVCRNCSYSGTCRNEVVRKDLAARAVGVPAGPPPSPFFAPQPVQWAPQVRPQQSAYPQPPTPVAVRYGPQTVAPQSQPQQRQAPQPLQPAPLQYGYGSMYDPMYYALGQVPEPFRPQVMGESFMERVVKNMILAAAGSVFKEGLLAVRQLHWWPKPKELPAAEHVVDVNSPRS